LTLSHIFFYIVIDWCWLNIYISLSQVLCFSSISHLTLNGLIYYYSLCRSKKHSTLLLYLIVTITYNMSIYIHYIAMCFNEDPLACFLSIYWSYINNLTTVYDLPFFFSCSRFCSFWYKQRQETTDVQDKTTRTGLENYFLTQFFS
jgi:hypothetical protein